MNTAIFDLIKGQGGLGLTSPALAQTADAKASLAKALSQVKALPVATPPLEAGFPSSWLDSVTRELEQSLSQLNDTEQVLAQKLSDVLPNISHASIAGRLEGVPNGCADLALLTGSLTGELEGPLLGLQNAGAFFLTQIDAYLADSVNASALMLAINGQLTALTPLSAFVSTLFSKEQALQDTLINTIGASSLAQTLTLLWDNPCAKALLAQTLPPKLKALLP
ncbi:MAG: hypothetical protein ACRCWP_01665 [Shewanella sp.]